VSEDNRSRSIGNDVSEHIARMNQASVQQADGNDAFF